jgi:hypothetical protein
MKCSLYSETDGHFELELGGQLEFAMLVLEVKKYTSVPYFWKEVRT